MPDTIGNLFIDDETASIAINKDDGTTQTLVLDFFAAAALMELASQAVKTLGVRSSHGIGFQTVTGGLVTLPFQDQTVALEISFAAEGYIALAIPADRCAVLTKKLTMAVEELAKRFEGPTAKH